jgi:glyoxylase-like metal-dependent hydrolase (beta-lactamase superfamily II)/rhodanese-related sulfurtransferase
MIEIIAVETPSLGDRGYLVTDGTNALVIDTQRDIDRLLAIAGEHEVTISDVFETHIHNDYVTGGLALARETGAAYHVNAADKVTFEREPVADGDVIAVGRMRLQALATPGHTFTHVSYALAEGSAGGEGSARGGGSGDRSAGGDGPVTAVFTGGSLLNGSTGRTDLLGAQHSAELASAQHDSVRRLASELPDHAAIHPTHGFGSFCSATPAGGAGSTIGDEKRVNPALTLDKAAYVESLLAGLDAFPAYYAHMAALNAAGPAAPDLTPPGRADVAELRRRIDAGEWVVDLRERTAFAAGHLRGALHFGLSDSMATYLGWLIPWQTPLTLIGRTPADVAAAQRDLVRIGIDRLAAAATGAPADWGGSEPLAAFRVASFGEYQALRQHPGVVLVDVRRRLEWEGSRIDGALHIPLHELAGQIGELPEGEVWVHCQAGYRASIAASMLDAAGRRVVLIDDDFNRARLSGLARAAAGR